MRRLWWLCGLVTFITAKGILSITFECDSGWIKRSYRCYKKFTASKSWYDARSACHNNGGCLASITDSSQDYFISQNFGSTQIWLGGSDETKEGQWTWIDTEDTFSYTNWRPSYTVKGGWWNSDKRYAAQPDNDGNEDCLAMYSPSISNRWNDRSCFNALDYVCMMGAKILPSLTPTSCECTTGECHIGSVLGKSKCTYTDVLFLIDDSGSMSKEWFTYSLNIAGKLVECMTIGPDEIRVSLMTFSSSTSMILDFDTYKTKEITKAAILNAPYRGSPESNIGQAMNNVRNVLQVNDINRLDIAIILTDGRTEGSINAQQLRNESIFVFAMGVGNYNQFNSDIFATNTTSEYIANPNDYFDLHQKVKKRINALCIDEMRPHIMSCEMEIHDFSGNKAQSPVIGSSECVNQQDFYGKYQVSAFSSHVMISGEYSSTMPNASIEDFHFGISEGLIEMLKRNKSAENQVVPDFQNQSMCIEVPTLADGETLLYNLTAIDIVKNEYQDSVTHFIDASPPTITDLWLTLNGYERIFTHYEADLSKMKLNFKAYDSHSGIAHVLWYLRKSSGGEIIGHGTKGVSRLTTTPNCSTPFNCYCPSVGLCENLNYTLDLNSLIANNSHHGQHNRQYVFEIQVINNANLMHSETKSILVDESAPERGVVQEGVAEGPDIDFTATNIVDVNWKGFIDHESGIKFYRLATANSCLTSDELSDQSSTLQYIDTEDLSMTVTLNVTGKMYTSVIAYNNALEPSIAACSDGIVWDKTPPLIRNITIADMHIVPTFVCFKGSVYLINENVRKVLTPCLCESKIQNDFVQYLPQEQKSNFTKDDCQKYSYFNETYLYLPHDNFDIRWNIVDFESKIDDVYVGFGTSEMNKNAPDIVDYERTYHNSFYHKRHVGISSNNLIYVFIKAINKAGLDFVFSFGPLIIDETPPYCLQKPKVSPYKKMIYALWFKSYFSDNEQREELGKVLYRIGQEGIPVTRYLSWHIHYSSKCINGSHCVKFPMSELLQLDRESKKPFYFEFHVYNYGGHFCTIQSEEFRLPSIFLPTMGKIYDVDPNNEHLYSDIDISVVDYVFCVAWTGIHHYENLRYEIGLGTTKNKTDIIDFHAIAVVDNGTYVRFCQNSSDLKTYVHYFVSLRVTATGGSIVMKSDGFVVIATSDLQTSLNVYDGLGCENKNTLESLQGFQTQMTNKTLNFHLKRSIAIGLTYTFIFRHSCSDLLILSSDVIKIENEETHFSFIPKTNHPVFQIFNNGSHLCQVQSITLYKCERDVDILRTTQTMYVHWILRGSIRKFIKNFQVLFFKDCQGYENCNKTLVEKENVGNFSTASFKTTMLVDGFYRFFVRPCSGKLCLPGIYSDGFIMESMPPLTGDAVAILSKLNKECQVIDIRFQAFHCNSEKGNNVMFYKWAVFSDRNGFSQTTPFKYEQRHENGSNITISACIKYSVQPHKKRFVCIEGYCKSGLSSKICIPVIIKDYPNMFQKEGVYDLNSNSAFASEIQKYRYTSNIGPKLIDLHTNEIDFARSSFALAGFIIGVGKKVVTWTIMKSAYIPINCEEDVNCLFQKESDGGYVDFSSKLIFEGGTLYYICARSQEVSQCSDGFFIDNRSVGGASIGLLSKQDLNESYGSAASMIFKSYLENPVQTNCPSTRDLRNRIVFALETSFFITPTPVVELEEITVGISINPEDFVNTTVPALLIWDPYSLNTETGAYGIWKHAAESCNEDITSPSITGNVYTVKICSRTFRPSSKKRSTTVSLTHSYQMTLTSMNKTFYNSPPKIYSSTIDTLEDVDVTNFQLEYEDYDYDDVVFTLIEGPRIGMANLSSTGLLNYTCSPDYFGQDFFIVSATDNSKSPTMVVKNITINITAVNDPPQFGLSYNDIVYDISITKNITLHFEGNDTKYHLFDFGFVDVDANDSILILESITNKIDINITLTEKKNFLFLDNIFANYKIRTRKEYTAEMLINEPYHGYFKYYLLGLDSQKFFTERLEVNVYILWSPCVHGRCSQRNSSSPKCDDAIRASTFDPYICECSPGYIGTWCEKEVNECLEEPCGLLYDCTDKINAYECTIKVAELIGILIGCLAVIVLPIGLHRCLKIITKKYRKTGPSPHTGMLTQELFNEKEEANDIQELFNEKEEANDILIEYKPSDLLKMRKFAIGRPTENLRNIYSENGNDLDSENGIGLNSEEIVVETSFDDVALEKPGTIFVQDENPDCDNDRVIETAYHYKNDSASSHTPLGRPNQCNLIGILDQSNTDHFERTFGSMDDMKLF